MTDKPNCSTCPHYITTDGGSNFCEIILLIDPKANHWDITKRTKIVGCLSHPGAREYLNKDTIEKLKELAYNAHCQSDYNTSKAYYELIALIKGMNRGYA